MDSQANFFVLCQLEQREFPSGLRSVRLQRTEVKVLARKTKFDKRHSRLRSE